MNYVTMQNMSEQHLNAHPKCGEAHVIILQMCYFYALIFDMTMQMLLYLKHMMI